MTEYELLDLAASTVSHMTETFNLYLTIISAYLLIAYFVATNLTTTQLAILNGLFTFSAAAEVWAMRALTINLSEILEKKELLSPLSQYEQGMVSYSNAWVIALSLGVIAALYFMWTIRRQASAP